MVMSVLPTLCTCAVWYWSLRATRCDACCAENNVLLNDLVIVCSTSVWSKDGDVNIMNELGDPNHVEDKFMLSTTDGELAVCEACLVHASIFCVVV